MTEINPYLIYSKAQQEIFHNSKEKFVIVPKGRRFGVTKGAANAIIEWACESASPMLWVDTINSNIDRYFERYIEPELKKNKIPFNFHFQKKVLNIFDSIIDFRSADAPESIEGFGYKKIILNEAGIILKDNYLYTNTILPMLMDYPESQLFAVGTPKGKYKKDGTKHLFYELAEKCKEDLTGKYKLLSYSSYDNPFLSGEEIKMLENEIALLNPQMVRQEIYGEFIEMTGTNPFFTQYNSKKHESTEAVFNSQKQLRIIIDFNINPFAVNFAHIFRDERGEHCHVFDEIDISNGSIPKLIDEIKLKYSAQLSNCLVTGDKMGDKRSIEQRDNASHYLLLQRGLGLRSSQIITPANPTHENSRSDSNYILYHFPDFKINPVTCPNTCRDMKIIQCDAYGSIIKSNRSKVQEQADHADNIRYLINTFLFDWIKRHSKK